MRRFLQIGAIGQEKSVLMIHALSFLDQHQTTGPVANAKAVDLLCAAGAFHWSLRLFVLSPHKIPHVFL